MNILFSILIFVTFSFSSSENLSLVNAVKNVIQKEEYIALAINKYILQTGNIPKKSDDSLDWIKLETPEYLGTNFNISNPITSENMEVVFLNNSAYIKGVIKSESDFNLEYNYLYNFYANKVFRVNTIPPINITKEKLALGSQVLYNDIQKEIVSVLNETTNPKEIKLSNQQCTSEEYFYDLGNEKLTYKYCKADNTSIQVYQEEPIYTENNEDLQYIISEIGAKAYVKIGSSWYEKYFIGFENGSSLWSASETTGSGTNEPISLDGETIQQKLLSYIPNSKDLMLRRDGGCMLANGDVFCWGNNQYKKAGIENYGQIDTSIKPYYVNTPVMLKVQINDTAQKAIKWYNNPYRVKFQKMAMNSTNVCGVSPIFSDTTNKYGGDLYCNGQIIELYYENIVTGITETSILSRNKFFAWGKSDGKDDSPKVIKVSEDGGPATEDSNNNELIIIRDEIYLKDIAMVEDNIAVLSDTGKIYTLGRNYVGALGIGSIDKFIIQLTPEAVKNSGQFFKKIFALRDIKTFGAIDSDNLFYIWGELPNGNFYAEPTLLSSTKFNPDAIFTNSKNFILKGNDGIFYRTNSNLSISSVNANIPSNAISASLYDQGGNTLYLYADNNLELKGSSSFTSCQESSGINCNLADSTIFDTVLNELNTLSEQNFASFTNLSIYQLDTVKEERFEDFEDGSSSGWSGSSTNYSSGKIRVTSVSNDGTSQIPVTKFLGNFSIETVAYNNQPSINYVNKPSYIEKTYTFDSSYASNEVEVEFDFYEIDTWDFERFTLKLNDDIFVEDNFVHDDHQYLKDVNDTGEALQRVGSSGSVNNDNDEKYHYKVKTKLDSSAKLKVQFSTRGLKSTDAGYNGWSFAQSLGDESWGIDNVRVKVKETSKTFVCTMTGFTSASQMYCWGNVGRSIPLLSTSLYDVSKISTINKLFISQEGDKVTQMSFDKYNNNGNLFLKYPTYIGGFDYPFYFK